MQDIVNYCKDTWWLQLLITVVMNKLAMRQTISGLACTLLNWFERKCIPIPEGVAHWKAIAADSEEFAEIRLAWE